MKAKDVTDEMLKSFRNIADEIIVDAARKTFDELDKELVACAINAVFGDATPINAEWLINIGYETDERENPVYSCKTTEVDVCIIFFQNGLQVFVNGRGVPTKTIGQLRALHVGLGIGEVK